MYGGAFDFFSFRPASMELRAWGRTWASAQFEAQEQKNNCSAQGTGWLWDGVELSEAPSGREGASGCFGPYPFAKGPFYFLSRSAAAWVVSSAQFAEVSELVRLAVERAEQAERPVTSSSSSGPASAGAMDTWEDVYLLEDAILGFWLSSHPSLRLVALERYGAWCDEFVEVGPLTKLLVAHRVPWEHFGWLSELRDPSSYNVTSVRYRWECMVNQSTVASTGQVPVPVALLQACGLRAQLLPRIKGRCDRCACTTTRTRSSRCNFERGRSPRVPEECIGGRRFRNGVGVQ